MRKNQVILISIGVLILIGFVFYFGYWQKKSKSEVVTDPCKNFPEIEGEIACKEAENIVLAQYPGDVKYVEKSNIAVPAGKPPDTETIQKDVWIVGVLLRDRASLPSTEISEEKSTSSGQSSNIEVAVDRYEKNILFYTTDCKKCLE